MIKSGMGSLLWLLTVPFFLGNLLLRLTRREQRGPADCMTAGYFGMFALCEVITVPAILAKAPFHLLAWLLAAIYLAGALGGILFCGRDCLQRVKRELAGGFRQPWTVYAAAAVVAMQGFFYVKYMVVNEDDAYYVAAAATALETDTMYRYSPYTGRALERVNLRYALSPFSMLQACLSKWMDIRPAALAHTVLPVFLVMLAYLVYYLIGRQFFAGDRKQAGLFVIMISMVNITSYYCVRTQGAVLLLRIWQGKAVLASILLPFLFYHSYRMYQNPEERGGLAILLTATTACCLVSSMGIALPSVMLGIFGILFGLLKKNLRYLLQMAAGCLPCICFGVLYLILKGL